ncbi:MAG: colanic acid biosynthesis glycosyltransferase WcaL [Rhodobacterales bacterium]|nr:MAG: colanic acid biosynthesis glycosyltransferase WcaL [Rhodobacterales bacterium]
MTIAYVLNTYPQPSHSFIRREIRALERRGLRIHRIAMRRSDLPLADRGDREEAGKTAYVLDTGAAGLAKALARAALKTPGPAFAALKQALRLGRASPLGVFRHLIYLAEAAEVKARCEAADVTHIHAHFGTNAAAVAMLAHELGGPAYSFTVHGPEEFDAPAALSLADKIAHAAFVVGVSQFGRSQLCRWTPLHAWDKIRVVHCGIEPEVFPDPAAPEPHPGLRLVAIGRFVEQKGQKILIEALAALGEAGSDITLTLVGDGELRGDLEAAIAAANLGARVRLTGWLDEAGVRAEIARADALVMPSFAEGLPMVIMEAMAMARPVISTIIAGAPELVLEGETGWLVPAGDPEALAGAILRLAATPPETRAEMGRKGRARAIARHGIDGQAARLAGHIAKAG